jgi:hypothetical protein
MPTARIETVPTNSPWRLEARAARGNYWVLTRGYGRGRQSISLGDIPRADAETMRAGAERNRESWDRLVQKPASLEEITVKLLLPAILALPVGARPTLVRPHPGGLAVQGHCHPDRLVRMWRDCSDRSTTRDEIRAYLLHCGSTRSTFRPEPPPSSVTASGEAATVLARDVLDVFGPDPEDLGNMDLATVGYIDHEHWPFARIVPARRVPTSAPATQTPGWKPTTTWKAVAAEIGVSTSTVQRLRKDRGDRTSPHFETRAALWAWWKGLHAPPDPTTHRRGRASARTTATKGGAVDWSKTKV